VTRDRWAVVAAIALALTATISGVRTGYREMDVDEVVYVHTLHSMQHHEGYYEAMRDALVKKEGAPPSAARAIRPPPLYLILRWFPERSWRWLAGLAFLASLLLVARLGRPFGTYGGLVAVVLAGLWLVASAPLLFLHGEIWGLPFLIGALLYVRRDDDWRAVACVVGAVLFRELYAVMLGIGFVLRRRRVPWLAGLVVVAALAAVHVALAAHVLSKTGHQVRLGNDPRTLGFVLRAMGLGDRPAISWLAIPIFAAAVTGATRVRTTDAAARLILPFAAVMFAAAVYATRIYWTLTFAPALAAWAPAAFSRAAAPHSMP